jgi:hydrogenase nickel incorporation protein HypA/HybF
MHELYLCQSIISSVKKSLPESIAPERVTEVRVEVGQLDAVVPETLTFLFDAIKGESGLKDATLAVTQIDVACRCRDCTHEFSMDLPIFICPACGSGNVEVLRGRGIMLTGITATDNDN